MKDSSAAAAAAASCSRLPAHKMMKKKDPKKSMGASRLAAATLHQVRKGGDENRHSRVGVSKLSSHLKKRLCWYVAFDDSKDKIPYVPHIKWKCPPTFSPDPSWLVAGGEESHETTNQKHREAAVEEALYPCYSPFTAANVEGEYYDDSRTPLVPLTPIEETNFKIAEAAAATLAAALKMGQQIDMHLLINILSDPQMVNKLMEGETSNPVAIMSVPDSITCPSILPANYITPSTSSSNHQTQDQTSQITKVKPREQHCKYFATFKGCRNGSKCNFKHDESRKTRKPQKTSTDRIRTKTYQKLVSTYNDSDHHITTHSTSVEVCTYFGSSKGCRYGSKCRYKHL